MSMDYVLLFGCPDRVGVLAAVESWIRGALCWPTGQIRLNSDSSGHLFGRIEFRSPTTPYEQLVSDFDAFAEQYRMQWTITPKSRPRMLVMAGDATEAHVLSHMLVEQRAGLLPAEIVAVGSTSDDLRDLVESYGVPFTHILWPTEADNDPAGKVVAHDAFMHLAKRSRANLIFLARFSRLVPDSICQAWRGQMLNIHHGKLGPTGGPAFPGANPYRQAADYGVKGVGASVNFVSEVLDGGGLAAQEWRHTEHLPPHPSTRDLKQEGRLAEIAASMTAVRLYAGGHLLLFNTGTRDHVVRL
jgi:formyltetrahydrofolate deformylase